MVAIRDQRIDIGHGVEKVWRIVYDVRSDPVLLMQTGYVRCDNNQVPVWRAYDPEDSRVKAGWREGVWQNIHGLVMPNDPAAAKVRYQMTEYDVGNGELVLLPKVEVKITYALREHLAVSEKDKHEGSLAELPGRCWGLRSRRQATNA